MKAASPQDDQVKKLFAAKSGKSVKAAVTNIAVQMLNVIAGSAKQGIDTSLQEAEKTKIAELQETVAREVPKISQVQAQAQEPQNFSVDEKKQEEMMETLKQQKEQEKKAREYQMAQANAQRQAQQKKSAARKTTSKIKWIVADSFLPGSGQLGKLLSSFFSFGLSLLIAYSVLSWIPHVFQDQAEVSSHGFISEAHAGPDDSVVEKAAAEKKAAEEAAKAAAAGQGKGGGVLDMFGTGVGTVVSSLATLFLKLLSGLLWFVLFWMGDLMDNTFILEGDIGEKIRSVWVIVRNFVNIFFALALVIVAFMAVIGYGEENYSIKSFIPKMAMALIAVNFTFLACKIVLDINNVLTTAVFAIPQNVTSLTDIAATSAETKIFKKMKCFDPQTNFSELIKRSERLSIRFPEVINQLGGVCFAEEPEANYREGDHVENGKQVIQTLNTSNFTKKDFTWAMATQFQGLHNLNKASQLLDPSFTNLTVNALFSIVFAVIYGTAYVAMFIVLLARMVVLWFTIMLSPLAAISIAIPDLLPEDLNIQKKFLDHAFIPLKMSIPLSFGYILISQMSVSLQIDSNIISDKSIDLSAGGDFARDISITSLLYGAASVAVIWTGVFMSTESVVGGGVVGSLKGFVENAGSTVAKWPTYLPIIPAAGGAISLSAAKATFTQAQETIEKMHRDKETSMVEKQMAAIGFPMSEMLKATQAAEGMIQKANEYDPAKMSGALQRMSNNESTFKSFIEKVSTTSPAWSNEHKEHFSKAMLGEKGSWEQFRRDSSDPVKLNEMMERARTSSSSGASTVAPDYGKVDEAFGADATRKFSGITLSDDDKKKAGMKSSDTELAPASMGATSFMQMFKGLTRRDDKLKFFSAENIDKVWDKTLDNSEQGKAFRTELAKEPAIKQILTTGYGTDPAHNTKLLELYKKIFNPSEEELAALKKRIEAQGKSFSS